MTMELNKTLSHPYLAAGLNPIYRKAIRAEKIIFDNIEHNPVAKVNRKRWTNEINRKQEKFKTTIKVPESPQSNSYKIGRPHKYNFVGLKKVGYYFVVDNYKKSILIMSSCCVSYVNKHQPKWRIKCEKFGDKLKIIRIK